MFARKSVAVAAAIVGATPFVGHAATITFTYDTNDVFYTTASNPNPTSVQLMGSAAAPSVTIPAGATLFVGADVAVTNNPNPASGGAYDTRAGVTAATKQPTQLGIGSFAFGITNSNASAATIVDPTQTNVDNPPFTTIAQGGFTDNAGGVLTPSLTGIQNTQGDNSSQASGIANIGYGGGAPAEIFNNLMITGDTSGTAIFTPVLQAGAVTYNTYLSGGTSTTVRPVYANTTAVAGTDTINNLAPLTVIVGNASPTATPLISLTTGTAPTGTSLGTLDLSGSKGNGSYNVATASFGNTSSGFVTVTGFHPATDPEVYGLQVNDTNAATLTADLTALRNAINATGGTSTTNGPVTAFLRTDPGAAAYGFLPAADDLILVDTAPTSGSGFLGFNFTSVTGATGTLAVSSISAVPEPTSLAALAVGATGLLVGRRRAKRAM